MEQWSAEPSTTYGECVFIRDDRIFDLAIRIHEVVFRFELLVEPAGKIAHGFCDTVFGICRRCLPVGAVTLDQDAHGVFMVVATLMGNICHKLIEIALLNLLQSISDAVQISVLWRMGANGEASTTLVTPTCLKARAIALATEAGKPDAWLTL